MHVLTVVRYVSSKVALVEVPWKMTYRLDVGQDGAMQSEGALP